MNSLYHIAILEGYLAQHPELPRNVQDAIDFFKQQATPQTVVKAEKPKKKRKMSPEQKERLVVGLRKWRESKEKIWTEELKSQAKDLFRRQGKTASETAAELKVTEGALRNAINRYKL